MNALAKIWWTAKGVGWDNLPRRLLQSWRARSGLLRRRLDPGRFSRQAFEQGCEAGVRDQRALWLQRRQRFLPIPQAESLRAACDDATFRSKVLDVCEKALAGEYLFFSHWYGRLGWPPDFNLDPVHEVHWPVGPHWTTFAHSGPPRHDIKMVWEPSRLSLAYYFGRAYARTGDDRWAWAFWTMFDAWVDQNPPQRTAAWACGQEMTFRLMALLLGAMVTLDSPAATGERLFALSHLAWQTGRHISVNINYARAQKNNHAISEAVGLWTVGTLFPELREAAWWRRDGARILAAEVQRQIYNDGSYIQHSCNYHRVVVDDLLWALALSRQAGVPLPPEVHDRFACAAGWLDQMMDPISGRVPNYGPNDGALVLPLDSCDYLDYRPTVQAARLLLDGRRSFEPGPWDEKALWLVGESALKAKTTPPARLARAAFLYGGYYILRGRESWGVIRCHTYRDRPNQADMLHFDFWFRGVNVLRDGGSYMYYAEAPWADYFNSTAAHNTIEVDGQDQMVKGPRFLWFHWTRAKLRQLGAGGDGLNDHIQCEHYGYTRLPGRVVHRRTIDRRDDTWTIIDDLLGNGAHDIAMRWRLCPGEWQCQDGIWHTVVRGTDIAVAVEAPWPCERVCGLEDPPEGWESLYYGEKTPIPVLLFRGQSHLPVRLTTWIGPPESLPCRPDNPSTGK
jgi:hypothetical protein